MINIWSLVCLPNCTQDGNMEILLYGKMKYDL